MRLPAKTCSSCKQDKHISKVYCGKCRECCIMDGCLVKGNSKCKCHQRYLRSYQPVLNSNAVDTIPQSSNSNEIDIIPYPVNIVIEIDAATISNNGFLQHILSEPLIATDENDTFVSSAPEDRISASGLTIPGYQQRQKYQDKKMNDFKEGKVIYSLTYEQCSAFIKQHLLGQLNENASTNQCYLCDEEKHYKLGTSANSDDDVTSIGGVVSLTCPISKARLVNPVVLNCGHCVDFESYYELYYNPMFSTHKYNSKCAVCGTFVEERHLHKDIQDFLLKYPTVMAAKFVNDEYMPVIKQGKIVEVSVVESEEEEEESTVQRNTRFGGVTKRRTLKNLLH